MKLLLDEMLPPLIASALRASEHDASAVAERDDLRSQPDAVVFAVAQREARIIVTEDRAGFRPLAAAALASGGSHSGLILIPPRTFPRGRAGTYGRLVVALEGVLQRYTTLEGMEHWLQAPES